MVLPSIVAARVL